MTSQLDVDETIKGLRIAATRVAELLPEVRHPQQRAGRLQWRIAQTAAHIVGGLELYTGFITGDLDASDYLHDSSAAATPGERNAIGNAVWLHEFPKRDCSRLARMVPEKVEWFIETVARADQGKRFLTEAGVALRGRLVAGGRKPWLGLRFATMLTSV